MKYRVYFNWKNRRSTTHKDSETLEGAIAIAKAKVANNKTLMFVEIADYSGQHYTRKFISREELLGVK